MKLRRAMKAYVCSECKKNISKGDYYAKRSKALGHSTIHYNAMTPGATVPKESWTSVRVALPICDECYVTWPARHPSGYAIVTPRPPTFDETGRDTLRTLGYAIVIGEDKLNALLSHLNRAVAKAYKIRGWVTCQSHPTDAALDAYLDDLNTEMDKAHTLLDGGIRLGH